MKEDVEGGEAQHIRFLFVKTCRPGCCCITRSIIETFEKHRRARSSSANVPGLLRRGIFGGMDYTGFASYLVMFGYSNLNGT